MPSFNIHLLQGFTTTSPCYLKTMHFFPHTIITFLCSFVVLCMVFEPPSLAHKKKKIREKVSFTRHWCIIHSKETVFSKFMSIFPVFSIKVTFLYFVFKCDVTKLKPHYIFGTTLAYMKLLQYMRLWKSLRWNKMNFELNELSSFL